jgi:peptidoglycan/xylan/chitin deacetylase (PgdA/CDA1 family)
MNEANRVPVLMYHRVGDRHNDWEARYGITPGNFAAHMQALADKGYHAVGIDALTSWLDGGPALPEGAVLITFDDGFAACANMPCRCWNGWAGRSRSSW